jgi:hypothetical protein
MTLTITAVPDYSIGVPPRMKLSVAASNVAPKAVPPNTALGLTRIHQDGSEHLLLTSDQPRVIPSLWTGFDYHAPYNQRVTYSVTAAGQSATGAGTLLSTVAWLVAPSMPTKSVMVDDPRSITRRITAIGDRTQGSRAGRYQPIEGKTVFVSDGTRPGVAGSIDLRAPDMRALQALLADDQVVLINTPGGAGWDLTWMWVQPGELTWRNPGGFAGYAHRHLVMSFEESADPDMDLEEQWTAGAARDYFAANGINAGQVKTLYANSADFRTNTRIPV